MIAWALSLTALLLAALPAWMVRRNLPQFQMFVANNHGGASDDDRNDDDRNDDDLNDDDASRTESDDVKTGISVLIPARDEESGIEACVRSALASHGVRVEVIVMDDHSTDRTPAIVRSLAAEDDRVRYETSKELPPGFNGKQHACMQLAQSAVHDRFVFIDADVRLAENGLATLVRYQMERQLDLLSAFPRQITGTLAEKIFIPMMHFILLSYLPLDRMRRSRQSGFAAGCGQLFLTHRESYERSGGHRGIAGSRHDGVKLPRTYRQAGLSTDVVDGTSIASCRMYASTSEVIRGVLKNAVEGIASPKTILPFTILLLGCSLLPWVAAAVAVTSERFLALAVALMAVVLSFVPRALIAKQLDQAKVGVWLHPLATIAFVAMQWLALLQHWTGTTVAWRGRS